MTGSSGMRPRTYSAPTPFGAPSLWPETLSASTPSARTSSGSQPAACTASVWNGIPCACASAASAAIGWTVPTSLLASITVASVVSGRSAAANTSGSSEPVASDRQRTSTSKPCRRTR